MKYKHCCVIDASKFYKTFVLVLNREKQGEDGSVTEAAEVQHYAMLPGETLIEAAPPVMRKYAGTAGFVRPKLDADTSSWIEGATEAEIATWEAEHPAPELPERALTAEERLTALEGAMLAMMGVRTDV